MNKIVELRRKGCVYGVPDKGPAGCVQESHGLAQLLPGSELGGSHVLLHLHTQRKGELIT
jgi:hypothetical protein